VTATTSRAESTESSEPAAAPPVPAQPKPGAIAITGAKQLAGSVSVGGSVRAALILLAAAALHTRPVSLARIPGGAHVDQMIALIERSGGEIEHRPTGEVTIKGIPAASDRAVGPPDLFDAAGRSAGAVHLIPALLLAFGCAALPWPPASEHIDDVLAVYKEFGDLIQTRSAGFTIVDGTSRHGTVELVMRTRAPAPTIAAVLRACSTGSRIIIRHPSRRPEVHALFTALTRHGWRGHFADDRLDLDPGAALWPAMNWTVPDDELEAAACVGALAATRSGGTINVSTRHLTVLRMALAHAGARVELKAGQVKVHRAWTSPRSGRDGLTVCTGPDPRDLPSDQFAVLLPIAPGIAGRHELTDRSAPARTARIVSQLKAFGVPFAMSGEPGQAVCTGPFPFTAPREPLEVFDEFCQVALVIAALAATGTTVIESIHYLHNAHPGLLEHLRSLGADIKGGAR
jgi:UDP-N-acetylglucosamine 1-carboxyvinyltransferase